MTNMAAWYDMRLRFDKNQTIDKVALRELEKEKDHWRKVLFRIILIVKFLAKHNLEQMMKLMYITLVMASRMS